jgi:hypothetical protein
MHIQARVLQLFLDFVLKILIQKSWQCRCDKRGVSRLHQIKLWRELIWMWTRSIIRLSLDELILPIGSQECGIKPISINISKPIRNFLDDHLIRPHDGLDAIALLYDFRDMICQQGGPCLC